MGTDKVTLVQYGIQEDFQASEWPSGDFLLHILVQNSMMEEDDAGKSDSGYQRNPEYWQASARWALLTKYGYLPAPARSNSGDLASQREYYRKLDTGAFQLQLSADDICRINQIWLNDVVPQSFKTDNDSSKKDDLIQFLQTKRGPKDRPLQWTAMTCAPGCQFPLHLHPNIELVYCIKGALHEVRMKGPPMTHDWEIVRRSSDQQGEKLQGPSLLDSERSFSFETLQQGQWLVNEVGSIHKSFTASSGKGATLMVLWGGRHADIAEAPRHLSIQRAVDAMDDRLSTCACQNWDTISETFLPESERSTI